MAKVILDRTMDEAMEMVQNHVNHLEFLEGKSFNCVILKSGLLGKKKVAFARGEKKAGEQEIERFTTIKLSEGYALGDLQNCTVEVFSRTTNERVHSFKLDELYERFTAYLGSVQRRVF